MIDYQAMLEQAAFDGLGVAITTKDRGVIVGLFIAPDEFDTDLDRYGFQVMVMSLNEARQAYKEGLKVI